MSSIEDRQERNSGLQAVPFTYEEAMTEPIDEIFFTSPDISAYDMPALLKEADTYGDSRYLLVHVLEQMGLCPSGQRIKEIEDEPEREQYRTLRGLVVELVNVAYERYIHMHDDPTHPTVLDIDKIELLHEKSGAYESTPLLETFGRLRQMHPGNSTLASSDRLARLLILHEVHEADEFAV
jgi:hypothetical protein